MNTEQSITVTRTCQSCGGEGVITRPAHCRICQQALPAGDPWWQAEAADLPCGHAAENLVQSTQPCPECHGRGQSQQLITRAEWQQLQRQRFKRSLILAAICLLVATFLVWVIGREEPVNICGSWWYGTILLFALHASLNERESGESKREAVKGAGETAGV